MKNAVLLLLFYSTVVTVFLVAYFLPIRQALARVFGVMNFAQRFILVFAFFTIVAVVGVFVLLLLLKVNVDTNLGQVGDFVGGLLNPILSFLALIAIVSSITLQEKELSTTVDSLKAQEKVFRTQIFESSFFNLLSMQRSRRSEQKVAVEDEVMSAYLHVVNLIYRERKRVEGEHGGGYRSLVAAKKALKGLEAWDSCAMLLEQFSILHRVISSASSDDDRIGYYWMLAYSDMDPNEALVLLNYSLLKSDIRRVLKKYIRVNLVGDYFISPALARYYDAN